MNPSSARRGSPARQASRSSSQVGVAPAVLVSLTDSRWAMAPVGFRPVPFLGVLNAALRSVPDFRNAGMSWLRLPGNELGKVRVAVGCDPDGRVSHSIFWTAVQSVAAKVSRGVARKLNPQFRSHGQLVASPTNQKGSHEKT